MVAWAAVFVGFNSVVRWGFFNYLPAIYLVPFALIAWDRFWLKRQSLYFIFYFALSLACYFGHFFSFFLLGLLIGARLIEGCYQTGRVHWRAVAASAAPLAVAIPHALLFFSQPIYVGPTSTRFEWGFKWHMLSAPFETFGGRLDQIITYIIYLTLASGFLLGCFKIRPGWRLPAVVLIVASVFLPHMLEGWWSVDDRVPPLAAIILLSVIEVRTVPHRVIEGVVLALIMTANIGRAISVRHDLEGPARSGREMLSELEQVPLGARCLPITLPGALGHRSNEWRLSPHAILLGIANRQTFMPGVFLGGSWLKAKPELALATPTMGDISPSLIDLADSVEVVPEPSSGVISSTGGLKYWINWRQKFDCLIVVHFDVDYAKKALPVQILSQGKAIDIFSIQK